MVANALATLAPGHAVFAIAGSALLFPYYFGLISVLLAERYIVPGVTPMAGISGGALVSAIACAGIPAETAFDYLLDALMKHPDNVWAVRHDIILGLSNMTSPGAYKNCSGKVHISMSELDELSDIQYGSTSLVTSRFEGNEDYWSAVVGSSTIACAGYDSTDESRGGPAYVLHRNRPVIDGAYANDLRTLCSALGLPYGSGSPCVSVQAYEPGVFRKYDKSPAPASGAGGDKEAARKGTRRDGAGWKLPASCSEFPNGEGLPDFLPAFDISGPWPSICPGCDPRNPLAFTREEWHHMALNGTAAGPHWREMFHLGARDGKLWVANQTECSSA